MEQKTVRCTRCVLPATEGHISFDATGLCSICNKQSLQQAGAGQQDLGGYPALRQKVAEFRGREPGDYDSLVALSGGKDSTMTLYLAVKELGLRPLAVFIDNGFCGQTMYQNVRNATQQLGVDLLVYRPQLIQKLFRHLLLQKSRVYYCRICNALIDVFIRRIALQYNIPLVLGGHTKGQEFLKGTELFWIYRASDENLLQAIKDMPEFALAAEVFSSLAMYIHRHFKSIQFLSPFHFIRYGEEEILRVIQKELGHRLPEVSWPQGSTNCLFNFVSQLLTVRYFGYSQHEAEISALVRAGELSRERALAIIETPITHDQIELALERIGLTGSDLR
jgi:hypothetical protein